MNEVAVSQERQEALASLKARWPRLSKLERGEGLKRLVDLGLAKRGLARQLSCSDPLVRQLIKLAEVPATVREEYEAREIGRKKALELGKKLQQVEPSRVKRQTRIKRGARALEAWVLREISPYAWEVFFGEVRYETEGPQGSVFKHLAQAPNQDDMYADPADVIADSRPADAKPTYGPDLTKLFMEWYARWFQRVLPDRADREEALRIVMAKLVPHM